MMKMLLRIIGIVLLLLGLLWAGQGAGIIDWPSDSFMLGASRWTIYGLIIAAIGLVLLALGVRRRS